MKPNRFRHGKSTTKVYRSWQNMLQRCDNPRHTHYAIYGNRGITYPVVWSSFEIFYRDMGDPPTERHSLDRIDNSKSYSKENCRWATQSEQCHNKRLSKQNNSGIIGVSFNILQAVWVAKVCFKGHTTQLYRGPDFLEAVCARKSWENKHVERPL